MSKGSLVLAVILVVGAGLFALARLRPTPPAPPPASTGIRTVPLSGPPRERGLAHGRELAPEIAASLERLLPADQGTRDFVVTTCGRQMLPGLPAAIRDEIEGIAEGSGRTAHEILFLNTRFELATMRLLDGPRLGGEAAARPMGEVIRTFLPRELAALRSELVLMIHRHEGAPMVLLTLPGMVGGLVGARGPMVATFVPELREGTTQLNGVPWSLLLRLALEEGAAWLKLKSTTFGRLLSAEMEPGGHHAFSVTHAEIAADALPAPSGWERLEAQQWTVRFTRRGGGSVRVDLRFGTEEARVEVPLAR